MRRLLNLALAAMLLIVPLLSGVASAHPNCPGHPHMAEAAPAHHAAHVAIAEAAQAAMEHAAPGTDPAHAPSDLPGQVCPHLDMHCCATSAILIAEGALLPGESPELPRLDRGDALLHGQLAHAPLRPPSPAA